MTRKLSHFGSVLCLILFGPLTSSLAAEDKPVLKFTAVDLTKKLNDDKDSKLLRELIDKPVEIEGEVLNSQRFAKGNGWLITLVGCELDKDRTGSVRMSFEADNPDLPKARALAEGDVVTIRGTVALSLGATVPLKEPRVVKGVLEVSKEELAKRKPDVKETAEKFIQQAVADPKAAEKKWKGKVVELSGTVSGASPQYSIGGCTLAGGKLKPSDLGGVFADCFVPAEDLEATWMLAPEQKVKVVGVLTAVTKDRVRLARCVVTELEKNPMPTVKATDLAAAYGKNMKEASKKYGDKGVTTKNLFLEGTIKGTEEGKYNTTIVTLEGAGKIAVRVVVGKDDSDGLKAGDQVGFKATCRGYSEKEGVVELTGFPLPKAAEKK